MSIITKGFELTTSLTNIIILVVSLFFCFRIKDNIKWHYFYLLIFIAAFLGVIVHGLVMSSRLNNILWVILCLLFTIIVNLLLLLFTKIKFKYFVTLSLLLSMVLLTQLVLNQDYLLTFTIYAIIIVIITTYYIINNKFNSKYWFLIGYLLQIIGAIILFTKIKIGFFNYNGIYHCLMAITLILFGIGHNKR